ncbi:putative hydrolase YxeP [Planctomycetes bacterium Pla163]|uniref:Putative hydrolase YxeP n=1 Tax=Rohdeia mirabilis TaxID=2528008 RepID=A0A518CXL4_9BACT|nr:putative hydrolase YxeP [Planctomycetes bacterium Pla163]
MTTDARRTDARLENLPLAAIRRRLHTLAERSNEERRTAEFVRQELEACEPDALVTELGGHGVAAVFEGRAAGPTVLLRCDLDALPMAGTLDVEHRADDPETAHTCGHDGHMTVQIGVARALAEQRPERGRVVLLFQPAEETGEGARAVLDDPRFAELSPTRAVAFHNLPGRPLGEVTLRNGPFASASVGMIVELTGVSSHAAEPHMGRSPVAAAANIAQSIQSAPQRAAALEENVQATVVGIEVGGPAFGTSPGSGRVMATLRAHTSQAMHALCEYCERMARGLAAGHGLECDVTWTERFPATENHPAVVRVVERAARANGLDVRRAEHPFSWSEDFGHFTSSTCGALFGLGSGVDQPPLHHPDFDFPDDLLEPAVRLFVAALPELLADELPKR